MLSRAQRYLFNTLLTVPDDTLQLEIGILSCIYDKKCNLLLVCNFFSRKVKIMVKVMAVFVTFVLRLRFGSAPLALLARNISWSVHTMHCGCDWMDPWVRVIGSQIVMDVVAKRKFLPFLSEIEFRPSNL
jgi:hypothetical protein